MKIVNELLSSGYDYSQIAVALCDGEVLAANGWTQAEVEEAYNFCQEKLAEVR